MIQIRHVLIFLVLLIIVSCNKKFDEYYERPGWLEGPIYQQLQKEGKFSIFLACLDSTGYKDILSRTGYFTVFAPNDQAFEKFFQEKGISSVDQLDTITIRNIVQYAIVDNGYTKRQLAAYQSSKGWVYESAFKRKTRANYCLTKDSVISKETGDKIEVYINNSNTKYIPYFIDEFLISEGLSNYDYETFFPNSEYTGFNIVDAAVIGEEIIAENGYIYELDKVNLPLPNIDECLTTHPQKDDYSIFKSILIRLSEGEYDTAEYKSLPVYLKEYDDDLLFAPNNEDWFTSGGEPNAPQTNGWTMFVPDNQAMNQFLNEKLLTHYSSIDQIMREREVILIDFINSHMFQTVIWPGKFPEKTVAFGLPLSEQNILSANIASNGFLYTINTILQSGNTFFSVFGEIFLNPEYSMMYKAIELLDPSLKNLLKSKELQYTILLISDIGYNTEGFGFDDVQEMFYEFASPGVNANEKFMDIFYGHIIRGDFDDLSGSGFLETINGKYLKYENNQLWGGGNSEINDPATIIDSITSANNGTLYKLDRIVISPTLGLMDVFQTPPAGASYAQFYQYLNASSLSSGTQIEGITQGQPLTILVPTDAAITAAGLPAYNSTVPEDVEKIKKFLQYHIIPDKTIFTDGKVTGEVKTLLFIGMEGRLKIYELVTVGGENQALSIIDKVGNTANVLNTGGSNVITSDNAVILQIDRVLNYE